MTALNLGIQESGNPEIWKSGIQNKYNTQLNILKIKIRVTQNVGKVWIRRKKQLPVPFGAISGQFFHGLKKRKTKNACVVAVFLGGPMGAIQLVWSNGCNISAAIRISSALHA